MLLIMYLEEAMAPHSSTLAGKSHGRWSLVGDDPWGCKELDTTERLHCHWEIVKYRGAWHVPHDPL